MASVASLGVGSNLDLSGLLTSLTTAESQPLVMLQKQQISYTAKLSAYGTLQNALSSFQSAASKLADAMLFQGVKVASSATDVLTASASATGVAGSYSIEVTQLAQSQSLAAAGVTDPKAVIGKGTVTLDFGSISGGTLDPVTGTYSGAGFSPDAGRAAQSIVIDDSNNSLEGLRDAINTHADMGVTASIVNDGGTSPYRLVLSSKQTGEASSMRIAVTGDASLQGLLNHDPSASQALQQTAVARNAALKVNGIDVTSKTNTVAEAVQGVTMTLARTGTSALTVSRDTGSVESAVSSFVTAYNSLQTTAGQLSRYDTEKHTGAALVGDSTLRTIQTRIRAALNTPQVGELKVLSKVGVSFQKDGTLTLDAAKLKVAFADNRSAVAELFAGAGGSTGVGKQMSTLVDTFTSASGMLNAATTGVKTTLKSLDNQYAATETRVQATVARYRAQFTELDMLVSRMTSTASYLTQQFANMSSNK
ncbi:flagellar filament capping protein FliD [Polaromonas sp.]|uniref:flagellar filament capping protein FliD n=1 Tax=Polaromonas sp. TaxID=1869339 RepID=UPI00273093C8|nr:flagellar filament capping protein FliD [Polaromonas sp.]MDP2451542.1 flagellar filament capping protein FliD [Polaromonas sp.]MDP3754571.1 flagellar filament capping protein FliD [Polaromonas sp.]